MMNWLLKKKLPIWPLKMSLTLRTKKYQTEVCINCYIRVAALDRANVSNRTAIFILAETARSLGLLAVSARIKYDHVTPILCDVLHWLPVPLRVEFKICLLVYKSLHGAAPGYLRDYCKETHLSALGLRLRSTDKCDLFVRRMKTRFGDRAFSAADPRCWNKLPAALRAANSIDSF